MSDFTTWRSLVDGEEIGVIPDSENLHAQYDATQSESITTENGSVTQWDDLSGNDHHLTGSATGTTTIGTNNAVAFDSDKMDVTFDSISTPYTIYILIEEHFAASTTEFMLDGATDADNTILQDSGDSWRIDFGGGVTGSATGSGVLLLDVVVDGTNDLFENGSEVVSDESGDNPLAGITIGDRAAGGGPATFDAGEILYYDTAHDASTVSEVRDYIESKWPVTIS